MDGIGLAEDTVGHVVAVVDARALTEHVLGFRSLWVLLLVAVVLVDVGADIGQEVGPVAGLRQSRAEADEVALVLGVLFAEEGKIVLLESGGGKGGVGVEEAGELGDDGVALQGC